MATARKSGRSSAKAVSRRRTLTEADILERSAGLFAARGYAATSVGDIADALGMSRPSLYHYFRAKDQILTRLIDDLVESADRALAEADVSKGPPDEALARLVGSLVTPIAESPGRFRLLQTTDATFTPKDQARVEQIQRSVVHSLNSVISEGVATGVFRRCNQTLAAFSILGSINWIAWWYDPKRGPSVDELRDSMADFSLATLRASRPDDGGPEAVISSIRRELHHLEDLMRTDQ